MLHHLADHMSDGDVGLLNSRRLVRGHEQCMVGHRSNGPPVVSRQGNRDHPDLPGHFESPNDVGRASARADADGDITSSPDGFDLFCKDFKEAVVIGNAGENRGIRDQRNGR